MEGVPTFWLFGYYFHDNLGDTQYTITIPKLLGRTLRLVTPDTYKNETLKVQDTIVFGGGDLINPYFLDALEKWIDGKQVTIVGFSVGIPYLSCLDHPVLKLFSRFYLRTFQDLEVVKQIFPEKVFYVKDASFELANLYADLEPASVSEMPLCVVTLSSFAKDEINLQNVATALDKLSETHKIVLVPFSVRASESDIPQHKELYKLMKEKPDVLETNDIELVVRLFKAAKVSVVMRFHALLFSDIFEVKDVYCISSSRKIVNYLKDTGRFKKEFTCTVQDTHDWNTKTFFFGKSK